jgi:hypothetical protein
MAIEKPFTAKGQPLCAGRFIGGNPELVAGAGDSGNESRSGLLPGAVGLNSRTTGSTETFIAHS